ncbi:hypothetical protein P3W45_000895 [Vairimorpha bombi]|jgi:hypothetical protein
MKYELYVKGEFTNIKGLLTDQTFPANVVCTACRFEHPKVVIITEESKIREKGIYKCNFEMKCHSCRNDIKISIQNPDTLIKEKLKDKYGDEYEVQCNPINIDGCKISLFTTSGGEISEIKRVTLDILTEDGRFFTGKNVDDKRSLCESYGDGKMYSIINYELVIKQVK